MITVQVLEQFRAQGQSANVCPIEKPFHYKDLAKDLAFEVFSLETITTMWSSLSRDGYVLINTDLDDFAPRTPTSLAETYSGPFYGEIMLAIVGQIVGELQSLSHQHNGRLFHDVMPIEEKREHQTSGSSDVLLEMHTELSFVEDPPEYLLLFCVRQDQARTAETHLYDSRNALALVSDETYQKLSSQAYRFRVDDNATGDVQPSKTPVAIIDRYTTKLLRFDVDTCLPVDNTAKEASSELEKALLSLKSSVRLAAGQLLLVDNKRMVHSRGAFAAHHDGNDRWLKRALVRGH